MDEKFIYAKLDEISNRLTRNESNLANLEKSALRLVNVSRFFVCIIVCLSIYLSKEYIKADNTNDTQQQVQIDNLISRVEKLEVINGTKQQP